MSVGVEGDPERAPNIAFLLVCQRGSPTSYFGDPSHRTQSVRAGAFFWIPPKPGIPLALFLVITMITRLQS